MTEANELNRERALKAIVDRLAWLTSKVTMGSSIHLLDANMIIQELFRVVLNELYDLELSLTDRTSPNFPAIDLADEATRRCFQLTSEKSTKKMQSCLDAFYRHGLNEKFGKIQVVVIGDKQGSYKRLKIPEDIEFDASSDILDIKDILKQIEALPTESLIRIERLLHIELAHSEDRKPHDWKKFQSSKISQCTFTFPLDISGIDGRLTEDTWSRVNDVIRQWIALAFGHTCLQTPFDDFVFILSFNEIDVDQSKTIALYELHLTCHITEFVWAFQEWSQFFIDGDSTWSRSSRMMEIRGDQEFHGTLQLGNLVPYRIRRVPPRGIEVYNPDETPEALGETIKTSVLLRVLAAALKNMTILWDDADKNKDANRVFSLLERIVDHGFSWSDIELNRENPEEWE